MSYPIFSFVGDNGDSKTTMNKRSDDKSPGSTPNLESTVALISKSGEVGVSRNKNTEQMTGIPCDSQNLTDDQKAGDGGSNVASISTFNSSKNIWSRLGVESSEFESRSPVFSLNSEMPQLVGYNTTEEVTNDRTPPHLSPHIVPSIEETDSPGYLIPNPLSDIGQLEKDEDVDENSSREPHILNSTSEPRDTEEHDQPESSETFPVISVLTLDCCKKDSNKNESIDPLTLDEGSAEKLVSSGPPTLSPNDNITCEQDNNSCLPEENNHSTILTNDESKETDSSSSHDVQIIDDSSVTNNSSISVKIDKPSIFTTSEKNSIPIDSCVLEFSKKTTADSVVKQSTSNSTSTGTRHVSFFEKAADFFGTNLIDDSDVGLSSTSNKSVFSSLVSDDNLLRQTSKSITELHVKSSSSCQLLEVTDDNDTNNCSSKINPPLPNRPSDFMFESCSVNELLMKEEEEEEGKDVSEEVSDESGLMDSGTSPESTTKSYLNKVVDMVMPSKAGSQLQTISSRLRTRMPHWDDAFNDAFVPQLHGKSVSSASPGSVHSHASDTSRRLKNIQSSGDSFAKAHDDDVSSLTTTYRDGLGGPVPLHVKKARQYLFNLEVVPHSLDDSDEQCAETNENGHDSEVAVKKVTRGDPVSKFYVGLKSKKLTYHEFKKAIRLPPALLRHLPTPVIGKVEGVKQPGNAPLLPPPTAPATAAPLPASPLPGSAVEFRSSLGAMVRTKARAFTKAALRRQIAEETSTARPHFRVKSRAGPDGGARSLALVITRVTRPPMKRSLSQLKAGEEEETANPATASALSGANTIATGKLDCLPGRIASESPQKRLKEVPTEDPCVSSLSDSCHSISGDRVMDDIDEDDATTPAMSQTTEAGEAFTPDIAPALSAADGESAATESSEKRTEDEVPEANKSHPEGDAINRTSVVSTQSLYTMLLMLPKFLVLYAINCILMAHSTTENRVSKFIVKRLSLKKTFVRFVPVLCLLLHSVYEFILEI